MTSGQLSEPSPVDFALLAEILGEQDRAELLATVALFLEELDAELAPLQRAFEAKDRQALQDAAHAAKSAASSAAAMPLVDRLDQLETSAGEAPWSALEAMATAVHNEHLRLLAFAEGGSSAG